MSLTNNQRNTLLTAIKANGTVNAQRLGGDTTSVMTWCNAASSTTAWNNAVDPQTADEAATYTTYDSLAAGKRDSWDIFLKFTRDYSKNKVRGQVVDVWGSATAASIAESVLLAGTTLATNAQAAIGGNTKTTGTVSAMDRAFTGVVEQADANWLVGQP